MPESEVLLPRATRNGLRRTSGVESSIHSPLRHHKLKRTRIASEEACLSGHVSRTWLSNLRQDLVSCRLRSIRQSFGRFVAAQGDMRSEFWFCVLAPTGDSCHRRRVHRDTACQQLRVLARGRRLHHTRRHEGLAQCFLNSYHIGPRPEGWVEHLQNPSARDAGGDGFRGVYHRAGLRPDPLALSIPQIRFLESQHSSALPALLTMFRG
jgi:hypothetical protein